ncbi:MAG: 3-oxoacid CoA-transferase subunit A [Anaerolineae bacterium]
MLNKVVADVAAAVADIKDGATLMVGGFGLSGHPIQLVEAVLRKGVKDLTIISNNAGVQDIGLGGLIQHGRVRCLICSFPTGKGMTAVKEQIKTGRLELKVIPQGTLVERIRAGGAGLGGILTPTGVGTELAAGRQILEVEGVLYVLEPALRADFALIHAYQGDRWGNLCYRFAARNFNPVMAMAQAVTIAEVEQVLELGALDPNHIHTPGVFVQRVVPVKLQSSSDRRN